MTSHFCFLGQWQWKLSWKIIASPKNGVIIRKFFLVINVSNHKWGIGFSKMILSDHYCWLDTHASGCDWCVFKPQFVLVSQVRYSRHIMIYEWNLWRLPVHYWSCYMNVTIRESVRGNQSWLIICINEW